MRCPPTARLADSPGPPTGVAAGRVGFIPSGCEARPPWGVHSVGGQRADRSACLARRCMARGMTGPTPAIASVTSFPGATRRNGVEGETGSGAEGETARPSGSETNGGQVIPRSAELARRSASRLARSLPAVRASAVPPRSGSAGSRSVRSDRRRRPPHLVRDRAVDENRPSLLPRTSLHCPPARRGLTRDTALRPGGPDEHTLLLALTAFVRSCPALATCGESG